MTLSFQEVAKFLDPVRTDLSVRQLARMFRWPGGKPPANLSLRKLLGRFYHPRKFTQKLLSYNTALLPGLKIHVGKLLVPGEGNIFQRFFRAFVDGLKELVKKIPGVGLLVKAIENTIELLKDLPGSKLLKDIANPSELILTLIREGLETVSDAANLTYSFSPKPALEARAREIGSVIRNEFDIAATCETFRSEERSIMLQAWLGGEKPATASGPDDSGDMAETTSGLFTISARYPIKSISRYIFETRGIPLRDSDAWANKGVLLAEIDIGFHRSRLEIFSTHLFAGGGLLNEGPLKLDGAERLEIQSAQLDELVNFIRQSHKAENVAILVGDFNMADDQKSGGQVYRRLMNSLRRLNFEDLWQMRNDTPGFTIPKKEEPSAQASICPLDAKDKRYCDDLRPLGQIGERVDYLFVQKIQPEHEFILDFARPRRRTFSRNRTAPDFDKMPFMSDHFGLETTLIATPR